jgi:hypothetical protein
MVSIVTAQTTNPTRPEHPAIRIDDVCLHNVMDCRFDMPRQCRPGGYHFFKPRLFTRHNKPHFFLICFPKQFFAFDGYIG